MTTPQIRHDMDKRGKASRYRANRELSFLHVALRLGKELGLCRDIASRDVQKFKEHRRTNYVDDEQYQAAYKRSRTNRTSSDRVGLLRGSAARRCTQATLV